MTAEEFWDLPRSTRPELIFGEIAENLPVKLPLATLARPMTFHIRGVGGGIWSGRLVKGRLEMAAGAATNAICSVSMERTTLRELVAGAMRDRGLEVMMRLGRPRGIPDLSRLPVRDDRADAIARLMGSVALELVDRGFGETHRVVFTFGGGAPAWETATTTVRVDLDEVVGWITSRADPRAILKGGHVRVSGDLALPARALALVLDV
jgi:hypothetical protein